MHYRMSVNDDLLDCLKEPINSVYNSIEHPNAIPQFFGITSLVNPNTTTKKLWPKNTENYVFPTKNYQKNPGKIYAENGDVISNWWVRDYSGRYRADNAITGECIDVNKSPYCVVDFDLKVPKDQREDLQRYIINKFNLNRCLVQTTSKGLHYYTRGADDETFKQYTRVSRHCNTYSEKDSNGNILYQVDLMVCNKNIGQSIIMSPGSYAKNSAGEIGRYNMVGVWFYDDLEKFSSFESRFRSITNTWLVAPVVEKSDDKLVPKYSSDSFENAFEVQEPDWDVIHQLKGLEIHGFTDGINAFSLLLAFASYSDDDFYKCLEYVRENCTITSNGSIHLSKSLDEIRSSKYFNPSIPARSRILKQIKNYNL